MTHVFAMETLTVVNLAGAVLAANLMTIAVIYTFWRAHKDWENFGLRDLMPMVLPFVFILAAFY